MNIDLNKLNEKEREELTNALVENLPLLRKKLGLSQEQLADQIGVSKQTIANFEAKRSKMPWVTAFALLMFFSLTPASAVLLAPLGLISKKVLSSIPIIGRFVSSPINLLKKNINEEEEK